MTKDSSDVPGQKHNEMHDIGTGVAKGPPPEKSLKERLKVDPKLFSVKLLVFLVYGGKFFINHFKHSSLQSGKLISMTHDASDGWRFQLKDRYQSKIYVSFVP